MATAGPNSPSAASGSGWVGLTQVYSSDDFYASVGVSGSSTSTALLVQGYGFSIPAGSSINGITVVIERKANVASYLKDYTIQLLNGSGTGVGSNKADTGTYWPTSDANKTYGSSSDTWSASLTDTDVNSSSFGVQIVAQNTSISARTIYVDYVSITIDYTAASGQPMQARSRLVPFVNKSRIGW